MRTKEITVYTLQDLKERSGGDPFDTSTREAKAYNRAIEKMAEWATMDEWWDSVYDSWKERLEAEGFIKPDISFSGFASQGDGASFTCPEIDIERFVNAHYSGSKAQHLRKIAKVGGFWARIERQSTHYAHENTVKVESSWWTYPKHVHIREALKELDDKLEEVSKDLMHDIYRDLETEYFYLTSEENLLEMAEANEYEFDEFGRIA